MKNSKIIYLFGSLVIAFALTSCLDKGGSELSITFQPAVVKGSSPKLFVLKNGQSIYSETHNSSPDVAEGDCGLVDFVWNVSDPSHVADSNFYTATQLTFAKLDKYALNEDLSDTTHIYPTEQIVSSWYTKSVLLEGNLFLFTEHAREFYLTDVDLSYNKEFEPQTETEGRKIYDLYLRISGDTTLNKQKEIKYNVVDLSTFINEKGKNEQDNKKDSLYFRIQYASAMKTDSVPVWKASEEFAVSLRE